MSLHLSSFLVAILALVVLAATSANAAVFAPYSSLQVRDDNDFVKVCTVTGQEPVCYSNVWGYFSFTCNNISGSTAPSVRIYKCDDSNCTQNCVLKTEFTDSVTPKYAWFKFTDVNWTNTVYYQENANLVSNIDFIRSNTGCRLNDVDDADHWIGNENVCIKGSVTSNQYSCSAGPAPRKVYYFNTGCTGTGAVTTYGQGNTSCDGYRIWNCSSDRGTLRAVVFRVSGAGAVSAFLAVVAMVVLALIF